MLGLLSELSREFGDYVFFRIGRRPMCCVSDPAAIRQILVTDAAKFTKSQALAGAKGALGKGLLTSEGELHKRQRRMIAPAFHGQPVKAYGDDFVQQARQTSESWKDGQSVDIGQQMTELTLRVVTRSLFGTKLEADIRTIGQDMAVIVAMFERVRNPLAGLLRRLPLPSNRRFEAALLRLDERINNMIHARQADAGKEARFDFLSLLLMARDAHAEGDGAGMTEKQVRDEAVTLFMAGHETTANALTWTWLQIAENPEAEAALHAELDDVLAEDRPATADDMGRLKYTRAVVAESMRLRPPAWIVARRCAESYEVGPYRVPAGTTLLMSQYLVHRDPRWWPDAEVFRPERWLEGAAEEAEKRPKFAYFPFGGGPRSCVGEPFAWLEAMLLLATLARRWRLSRTDDAPVRLFPTITLRPRQAVQMRLHRRA
jgi:cytochrome P450